MTSRLSIVGVMGSGTQGHPDRAVPLGEWLATLPVHLLTGGGAGVMGEVCRAFAQSTRREGLVIGILPAERQGSPSPMPGYPNEWVELAIHTHLHLSGARGRDPLSRNHINVLSSDLIVALPGGWGTSSEISLAVEYRRPVVAFVGSRGDIPGLPDKVPTAKTLEEVQEFVRSSLNRRLHGAG
ncbi:MAG TPA: hypothetical protein VIH26_02935 [Anaerolineales bacterium]